jgi:hypothetical protein
MRVCQACVRGFEGIGVGVAPGSAGTGGPPASRQSASAIWARTVRRAGGKHIHHISAITRGDSAGGFASA